MRTLQPLLRVIALLLPAAFACKTAGPSTPLAPPATQLSPSASTVAPEPLKLGELAKFATKTDKGPHGHNYVEVYERFIVQWRYEPIKIFEIGIEKGGSLLMWQGYFPNATIFGLDIDDLSQYANERVKTLVGDQAKRPQLRNAVNLAGGDIDLVVDDGGHTMEQQQVSLGFLFKFVKAGGYYILEDIHTSIPALWQGYGVEPDGSNSTLRMIQEYMQSVPPTFKSKYMLPEERKYLDENVEFANLLYRSSTRSIVCIFKKRK